MTALAVILVKLGVSLFPYSGKGKPPMFGDYEAQRHWMEVTVNLPIRDWYQNTTDNDLLYWGLDYPPLTAYHSWAMGSVANRIDPAFVELGRSRGHESPEHQFFMRMSVLIPDILIFLTGLFYYLKSAPKLEERFRWVFLALASHPGSFLIDYGHFQYNCISLGLALWSIALLLNDRNVLAAVAFSAALNYKQMELYHALPIFFYLLAACRKQATLAGQFWALLKIGLATLATFGLMWYPFLSDVQLAQQVLHRVFPFNRGIFEDYVANFWCCLNVVVKLKRLLEPTTLAKSCLALTALFSLPSGIHLYFRPNSRNLLLSLINVSLSFFLFSYHVHEKSILLPALPVSLIAPYAPLAAFWFLSISHFSMLPLYIKDDLVLPSFAVLALYFVLGFNTLPQDQKIGFWMKWIAILSASGCVCLSLLSIFIPPPEALPHLWTLGISAWSFIHFVGFLGHFLKLQLFSNNRAQSLKKLN